MNISFDFDGTIKGKNGLIFKALEVMTNHRRRGDIIFIVTSRYENAKNKKEINAILNRFKLGNIPIFFTNGGSKIKILKKYNITIHYDNNNIKDMDSEVKIVVVKWN